MHPVNRDDSHHNHHTHNTHTHTHRNTPHNDNTQMVSIRRILPLAFVCALVCLAALPLTRADSASASASADEVEVDTIDDLPDVPPPATNANDATQPPPKNAEPISLSRQDFCRSCYSVVEEFHKCQPTHKPDTPCNTGNVQSRRDAIRVTSLVLFSSLVLPSC